MCAALELTTPTIVTGIMRHYFAGEKPSRLRSGESRAAEIEREWTIVSSSSWLEIFIRWRESKKLALSRHSDVLAFICCFVAAE